MKKFILFTILTVSLIGSASAQVTGDLTDGLVAFYSLNGNALDGSGNGNNGIVHGTTPTTDQFGSPNGAMSFNGIDDYISLPTLNSLGLGSAGSQLTTSINFYASGAGTMLGDYQGSQTGGDQVFSTDIQISEDNNLSPVADFLYVSSRNYPSENLDATSYYGNSNVLGSWHQVVYTLDGKNNASVYLDCRNVANLSYNSSLSYYDNPSWQIGGNTLFVGSLQFFTGSICDVGIWNTALTSQQVSQLYALQSVPEPSTYALFGLGAIGMLMVLRRKMTA